MNQPSKPWTLAARARGFINAFRGIAIVMMSQPHAWFHAVATMMVCAVGVYLRIGRIEWALLVIAITTVWMAEAFNTAIEFTCDAVTREHHPLIGKAKDVAAGAVLIAAIGAAIVGAIVFLPYMR